MRKQWTRVKRGSTRNTNSSAVLQAVIIKVEAFITRCETILKPLRPNNCWDMQDGQLERLQLVRWLIHSQYDSIFAELLEANPDLTDILRSLTSNNYTPGDEEQYEIKREFRLSTAAALLIRNHNPHHLPALNVILTIYIYQHKVPQFTWNLLCAMRLCLSRTWLHEKLLPIARQEGTPCPYSIIPFVGGAAFDNWTLQVAYKGLQTISNDGYRLDMTNWLSISLPTAVFEGIPGVTMQQAMDRLDQDLHTGAKICCHQCSVDCGGVGLQGDQEVNIFRSNFDKYSLVHLFDPEHPEILANKERRFVSFITLAKGEKLFERPSHTNTYGRTHRTYRTPIWDKLQSSEEDCKDEIDTIRAHPDHCSQAVLFLGEDGLSTIRHATILETGYNEYLFTKPATIPMQGDLHNGFHFMHSGWRNYEEVMDKLLRQCQHSACFAGTRNQMGNLRDPIARDYNLYKHACCITMRAVSEWFVLISESPGGVEIEEPIELFVEAISKNVDTLVLYNFLDDFCFHWWQMIQLTRSNEEDDGTGEPADIDLLWREAMAGFRTSDGNKTHYGWLAVFKLFWSNSLVGGLQIIHSELRTLSLSGNPSCQVGWDMLPEHFNKILHDGINPPVSRPYVEEFCQNLNFTDLVCDKFRTALPMGERKPQHFMKNIDEDVGFIKDWLVREVGGNWYEATAQRTIPHSVFLNHRATRTPHQQMMDTAFGRGSRRETYAEYVRRHLENKIPWM